MLDKAGRASATPKHLATIACSDLRVAPLAVQRREVALLVAFTIVTIVRRLLTRLAVHRCARVDGDY